MATKRIKFQIIVTDLDTGEEITKRCRDFRPRVQEGMRWEVFKVDDQSRKYATKDGAASDTARVEEIQYGRGSDVMNVVDPDNLMAKEMARCMAPEQPSRIRSLIYPLWALTVVTGIVLFVSWLVERMS